MPTYDQADGAERSISVFDLKTECIQTPLGVDVKDPRFSWKLTARDRNVRQAAYQITAASSADDLKHGKALLWDSGRVESDRCFEVPYCGQALVSRQRVYWSVRVWDDKGRWASATSWFEMGLLVPGDWQAEWLEAEDPRESADRAAGINWIWADVPHDATPVQFRFQFDLAAKPKRAELFLSVKDKLLGVWVNGQNVEIPRPLFWGTMCRLPLDLNSGSNTLCIEACALIDDFLPVDGGAVAALLRIEAADRSIVRLTTGSHWRATNKAEKGWQAPLFDDGRWQAAVRSKARMACEPLPGYSARLLRRSFKIAKPVARARLYATALGVYQAFINGEAAGNARLSPEVSVATDHIFYQINDVTKLVRQGDNAVGIHVADGWYAGALGWRNERYSLGDAPKRVLAQLVIDYQDGTHEVVATDPSWRSNTSPVLSSDIYNGEKHDARIELPNWACSDFNDANWEKARIGAKPAVRLVPQIGPCIREVKTLSAVKVSETADGVSVFDFGQNFSGWGRLHTKGAVGTEVTLRYAEILTPTGEIDQSNLRGAAATDSYVLRGDTRGEVFEPRFTYHGFRYVECNGPGSVEGVVAHSALPETGTISVENSLVQRLCDNTLWSQRSNFFGMPTDCPQRDERMGWLGDIQVFLDAASFSMDTDAFIRRFLHEIRAGQSPEGEYPVVAPQPRSFPFMSTAGWSEAGIILPWVLYERYGDTRVIDQNWEAMSRWMRFVQEVNPDWLWRNRRGLDLGDWLSVDAVKPADETTPRMLAATAFWAYAAQLMADMAAATGRSSEEHLYRKQHDAIVDAFGAAFVTAEGVVGNGSQTSYVLALKFGLVPERLRSAAAARLAAEIAGRGMKLSTGFLGTPYLLDVLCDNGQVETAIRLLLQTEYPSWGYMLSQGATTIWERWNGDVGDISMNSYSHYALGAVVGFIYRRIGGIAPAAPGFRHIIIDPIYDQRLGCVAAEYESCLGRIATKIEGDVVGLSRLSLHVPANATAEVRLPRGPAWREQDKPIGDSAVIKVRESRQDQIVLEIGSGEYIFER